MRNNSIIVSVRSVALLALLGMLTSAGAPTGPPRRLLDEVDHLREVAGRLLREAPPSGN